MSPAGASRAFAAIQGGPFRTGSPRARSSRREVSTPRGPARAHLWTPPAPAGALVLGHGAGGSAWSADLLALVALADRPHGPRWQVVLVEQPWRVAGRRVAAPPPHLDDAWLAVLGSLRTGRRPIATPLVVGGRSAGARVACRTAATVGADAVLALSFPLHPPGSPEKSRAGELARALALPLLVVQGRRDPFGGPAEVAQEVPGAAVAQAAGTHSFAAPERDVVPRVVAFLDGLIG